LLDDAEALGRGDPVDHLERRVRVPVGLAELARRVERADALQVIVEADDEADAAHLAGREDVNAGALLIEQRELGRVLGELAHVRRPEATGGKGLPGQPYPARQAVAADDGGRKEGKGRG